MDSLYGYILNRDSREPFMEEASQQDGVAAIPADDASADQFEPEEVIDYSELIAESAFVGDLPFDEILNGLTAQFQDYINMEDETNYVDAFYHQWDDSKYIVDHNDEEEHPMEIREALQKIKDTFIDAIFHLFESRLMLNISVIDDPATEEDEAEIAIRKLYEYFILGARDNFITVISKDIVPKIGIIADDTEYFAKVDQLLSDYDPLITCMTPTEFISATDDEEVLDMFDENVVSGNFLRKYSAKLYQNEEFRNTVINEITIAQNLKEDMLNNEQQTTDQH